MKFSVDTSGADEFAIAAPRLRRLSAAFAESHGHRGACTAHSSLVQSLPRRCSHVSPNALAIAIREIGIRGHSFDISGVAAGVCGAPRRIALANRNRAPRPLTSSERPRAPGIAPTTARNFPRATTS
jgi:hypothetical protein